jgi:hypothetical protein
MKDDGPLEDLLKPLSAKVGRQKYTIGGREMKPGHARMADAKKLQAALTRRAVDAERKKRGGL